MVLSDRDIEKCLREGRIKLSPEPDLSSQLGSCSIDLRLGTTFRIFNHSRHSFIDLREGFDVDEVMKTIEVPENESFVMQPGEFVLATTVEHLEIADDLMGRMEGRSSLGRIGIIVHGTAGVFDPGWRGKPTMELGNLGRMPVALYPGMRICSFNFEELSCPARVPYRLKPGGKYVDQDGPLASRISREV